MNREQFHGQWNEIKGKVKEKWGKLTEDDLKMIDGKREQLIGMIQKKYGLAKEKAERELTNFEAGLKSYKNEKNPYSSQNPYNKSGTFENR